MIVETFRGKEVAALPATHEEDIGDYKVTVHVLKVNNFAFWKYLK